MPVDMLRIMWRLSPSHKSLRVGYDQKMFDENSFVFAEQMERLRSRSQRLRV